MALFTRGCDFVKPSLKAWVLVHPWVTQLQVVKESHPQAIDLLAETVNTKSVHETKEGAIVTSRSAPPDRERLSISAEFKNCVTSTEAYGFVIPSGPPSSACHVTADSNDQIHVIGVSNTILARNQNGTDHTMLAHIRI